MGETALSILAAACDYLQLQVAQNYLCSLKCLTFYSIPRTNSFLETFLRDKKNKTLKSPRYFSCGEEPVGKHDFEGFVCVCVFNVSCISPLL